MLPWPSKLPSNRYHGLIKISRSFSQYLYARAIKSKNIDHLANRLFQSCRDQFDDISQAHDEVRWAAEAIQSSRLPYDIDGNDLDRLDHAIESLRIQKRMPLAYIIGRQPFGNLSQELIVRPPVLIPRAETADWVMQLIQYLKAKQAMNLSILDLGCGSGCISLLLHENIKARITGIDASGKAIDLATENASLFTHGPSFLKLDMFDVEAVKNAVGQIDLIVSNPPYISCDELDSLSPEVRLWEDKSALIGSSKNHDGLHYYKHLIRTWSPHVKLGIWFEVGHNQATSVQQLFQANGWSRISTFNDQIGVQRCVAAWK